MTWWREAVIYQIYPRSFLDSNGDGVGDLEGIRAKLGYLAKLGVDALWLSPIFPSPMRDFGYDVASYTDVDPVFGTIDEFDRLVNEAHGLGIRVLLDWVPNHTSSDHPWFVDARRSREAAHRDFYIWRDPGPGPGPPNNWVRAWSDEPTWTWDDATAQYYLHCFLPSQPDLNWANVEVRDAMSATLRFWLDRGVDGFRMDVIHLLGKELDVDDPEELRSLSHTPLNDVPSTHSYLREIRHVMDSYDGDRVSIGEVYLLDPQRVASYYGHDDELHLSFNFASMFTPWRAEAWRGVIEGIESALAPVEAWPTWVLSNHDNARVATRLGGDRRRIRAAMVLLLTLRGTPFLYQGEELGLEDAVVSSEDRVDPGGRDGCRSPMPWTAGTGHGWPSEPWMVFAQGSTASSVESQQGDDDSMLHFTRRVIALRRSVDALRRGTVDALRADDDVLSFERTSGEQRIRVLVNFSAEVRTTALLEGAVLLSSARRLDPGALAPGEAVVLQLGTDVDAARHHHEGSGARDALDSDRRGVR